MAVRWSRIDLEFERGKRRIILLVAVAFGGCHEVEKSHHIDVDTGAAAASASTEPPGAASSDLDAHTLVVDDDAGPTVPDEVVLGPPVKHPCPQGVARCILLVEQHRNWSWGYTHTVWILDTTGREYELDFSDEKKDPLRDFGTKTITQAEFERAIAGVKARAPIASGAEVAHAVSLLSASRAGMLEDVKTSTCYDGGGERLDGFWLQDDRKAFSRVSLRETSCERLKKENTSPAARALAQWVDQLRRRKPPRR